MVYFILFLFCVLFVEILSALKVSGDIQSIFVLSRKGIGVLGTPGIDDDEKERIIRRHSLLLFKATFIFALKILVIILLLYSGFFILSYFYPAIAEKIIKKLYSVATLAFLTILTMGYMWIRNSFNRDYSFVDRLLHYVAFLVPFVQNTLIDIENDLFKKRINGISSEREVFVTGLPRSGTTLLLEMLYETNEFSTFTYRHMPFILSPLLWTRLTSSFQKTGKMMERTHGDGMEIGFNSPEAFEEILWLFYMRAKIDCGNSICELSVGDQTPDFEDGFRQTIKKLIAASGTEKQFRYLSKNNANISRIELIYEMFPSSIILVPFRHPLAHVGSLLKQHQKFTAMHKNDKFAKRYMKWLGHHDFGENFKPINFDNWLDGEVDLDYNDKNFWLKYWIASYNHLLNNKTENVYFVDFDKLLADGEKTLSAIAHCLDLENKALFVNAAERLRSPSTQPSNPDDFQPEILKYATETHKLLKLKAI